MAASFPGTLWTWTDQVANVSTMDIGDINAPAAEIIAIQTHLGAGSIAAGQMILSGTAPWLRLYNTTEEDTDGGRESQIQWRGEQSGGEISTLGLIEISHDGSSDDEKGKFFLKLNDANDANSPTTRLTVDSAGDVVTTGTTNATSNTTGSLITPGGLGVVKDVWIGGKMFFGGETDWGTGATGVLIDGTGYDWASQTIARVNANLNSTAAAAAYHAMSITASQTSSNSIFGTWTELYVSNSVDLTGADNFAAVWGQFEAGTGVTLSDTGCFTAGVYANVKAGATMTVASGHSVNGVRAQLEVSAISNSGKSAAFECLKNGGVDWDYGIYIADATTGIYSGGKMVFGGVTDWGTGATGTLIDGTGYDWVSQTVGHVDSGALATACAAAYHALTVTPATHSTASSFFGTWTELYIQATQNMANSANCAAVWGQIEMGATVTTTDVADCFTAGGYFNIITGSTFVNNAAHVVNGVRVQSEISSTTITNSGRLAAFECLTKSGSYQDWDYGIYADGILRAGYFNSSLTGSSALNSLEVTVGDATTPASGYAHGIHVTYNKSGVDTGSGASTMQFNAIGADVTVSGAGGGTAGYYSLYTYVQKSGSPDLSNCAIFGANLEMTEMGATDYFGCLWLNKYNTTKGSTTDSFILMTNQGSGVTESAIDFLGTGYPDYFLKFAANSGGFLDAGAGDTAACSGHIEVNTPSGSKYIRLYASAS